MSQRESKDRRWKIPIIMQDRPARSIFLVEIKKDQRKPSTDGSESRSCAFNKGFVGFDDSYTGYGSGNLGPPSYRALGGFRGKLGEYGGYGGGGGVSEFGGSYRGFGGSGYCGYRGKFH